MIDVAPYSLDIGSLKHMCVPLAVECRLTMWLLESGRKERFYIYVLTNCYEHLYVTLMLQIYEAILDNSFD
jgi:hypothetical protein